MHGYSPAKDEYLKRLRRVEGQVRGLQKMAGELGNVTSLVELVTVHQHAVTGDLDALDAIVSQSPTTFVSWAGYTGVS